MVPEDATIFPPHTAQHLMGDNLCVDKSVCSPVALGWRFERNRQRLVLKHVSGVRWADGRLGRLEGERLCLLCHRRLLDDILEYDVPAWLDAPAWNALSPPPVANVAASAFGWLYDGARDAVSAYTAADGHALVASVVGMSIPGASQTPAAPPPIMVQTRPPRHARKGSTPPPHPPSPPSLLRPSAMDMNLDAID